jgi:hypothetical protein
MQNDDFPCCIQKRRQLCLPHMKRIITMPYHPATARKPLPIALDSSTSNSHAMDNPLWIIVIAMACFFGVASLVIATS